MFDNFTFAAQQTRHLQHDEFASPTDISFNSAATSEKSISTSLVDSVDESPVNNITDCSTDPTLSLQYKNTQDQELIIPALIPDDDFDESEEYTVSYISTRLGMTHVVQTPSGPVPSTTSCPDSHTGCKRLQRQINTQLQCCANHVKDIKSLVEDMISTNSQCTVHPPSADPSLTRTAQSVLLPADRTTGSIAVDFGVDGEMSEEDGFDNTTMNAPVDPYEDEGFAEMDDEEPIIEVSLRRASTPIGIRKYSCPPFMVKYSSVGSNQLLPRERHKIRCIPRIRKRVPSTTRL